MQRKIVLALGDLFVLAICLIFADTTVTSYCFESHFEVGCKDYTMIKRKNCFSMYDQISNKSLTKHNRPSKGRWATGVKPLILPNLWWSKIDCAEYQHSYHLISSTELLYHQSFYKSFSNRVIHRKAVHALHHRIINTAGFNMTLVSKQEQMTKRQNYRSVHDLSGL